MVAANDTTRHYVIIFICVVGCQELIYMSHIVDPHNFYVQRASDQKLVKELLREYRNAVTMPKPLLCHVAEGMSLLLLT